TAARFLKPVALAKTFRLTDQSTRILGLAGIRFSCWRRFHGVDGPQCSVHDFGRRDHRHLPGIGLRSARGRLLRTWDGYLIYGPKELFGLPQRSRSVDLTTGLWGTQATGPSGCSSSDLSASTSASSSR